MTPNNKVLVLDDEPHLLDWLREYLENKGFIVKSVTNVTEAIAALDDTSFRLLVLDLNVPIAVGNDADEVLLYKNFPGLSVADYARNKKGYRGRQVIVYSVHDHEEVRTVVDRISVTYCLKGRPRKFKEELDAVLSFDPSKAANKVE